MTETRGITWRNLKEGCAWVTVSIGITYCCHKYYGYRGSHCNSKNCPVWKKLKVIERQ